MALNLVDIQDAILAHLKAKLPDLIVEEQSIPDSMTLKRVGGSVQFYVTIQFDGTREVFQGKTFSGVRYDDHDLIINTQVVGPNASNVRRISANRVMDALLGFSMPYTSQMRLRPGGASRTITSSNGATEAYMTAEGYAITFQMDPS